VASELRGRVLVGWKIWFQDGLVLDSRHNIWEKCRQEGIQVVKKFYRSDKGAIESNQFTGEDYYILDDLLEVPPTVKIGKAIHREKYEHILRIARDDSSVVTEMF